MKKRLLAFILAAGMVFALAACGSGSTTNEETTGANTQEETEVKAPEDTKICLAISTLANDFMSGLNSMLEEKFTSEGYQFESANADGDSNLQIQQIENFITMGADAIIVMGVEPQGLADVCQRAMDQGICVYAFTASTKNYTVFCGASETILGESIAEMAANWVEETFPDAEPGTVNCLIYKYMLSEQTVERSEALSSITEYTDKVNIVSEEEVGYTMAESMETSENLAMNYDDIQLVLCYNGEQGLGVNSYVQSNNSRWTNYETFGVFGSDSTEEILANIQQSATNESVYRGSSLVSGGDMETTVSDVYDDIIEVLSGATDYEKEHYAVPTLITSDNVEEFM